MGLREEINGFVKYKKASKGLFKGQNSLKHSFGNKCGYFRLAIILSISQWGFDIAIEANISIRKKSDDLFITV